MGWFTGAMGTGETYWGMGCGTGEFGVRLLCTG